MYTEIEIIETVECKKAKIGILLIFIEEYGGWLQHLRSVGKGWGSNGYEVGANNEAMKTKGHIERLMCKVLELSVP